MKAVLLCAGRGSRLDPLTRDRPKCLVSVAGKSILQHQIEALAAAGISQIVIVGGYRIEQVKAHLQAMESECALTLVDNPYWATTSSIGSVWAARSHLDQPFCLLNGDTLFDAAVIGKALEKMRPGINLVVELGPPEHDDMRVAISGERIITVGKWMSGEVGYARSLGIVLSPNEDGGNYRSALEAVIGAPYGEQSFHHAIIDRIAQSEWVHPLVVEAHDWQEIDRPDDIIAWEQRMMRRAA